MKNHWKEAEGQTKSSVVQLGLHRQQASHLPRPVTASMCPDGHDTGRYGGVTLTRGAVCQGRVQSPHVEL